MANLWGFVLCFELLSDSRMGKCAMNAQRRPTPRNRWQYPVELEPLKPTPTGLRRRTRVEQRRRTMYVTRNPTSVVWQFILIVLLAGASLIGGFLIAYLFNK